MARVATLPFARQIETLFESGSAVGLPDRELLNRFTTRHHTEAEAEAAFAAIVSRHGPMVLQVCTQLLRDRHHAEDAFQAVFLVLARKARSIQNPDKLSSWLHGVALRTAKYARPQIDRRRNREVGDLTQVPSKTQSPDQIMIDREQAERLHTEIAHLPERFRLPLLLCDLEGLTLDAAATQLACPPGTLRSRLARAREKLKARLTRHGLTFSTTTLIALLTDRPASAHLCYTTARAALQYTAGHTAAGGALSASAIMIAQQVIKTTLVQTFKAGTISLLAMGAFAAGVTYINQQTSAAKAEPAPLSPSGLQLGPRLAPKGQGATPPTPAKSNDQKSDRMIVTAHVFAPDGKPIKAAAVDVVGRPREPWVGARADVAHFRLLGQGMTNSEGRLEIEAPRTSSTHFFDIIILSAAPGYGLVWSALNADADKPGAELRLRPECPLHVRLVDILGSPVPGIEPVLTYMAVVPVGSNKLPDERLSLWPIPPKNLLSWPKLEPTDNQGNLLVRGIGPDLEIGLNLHDMRYAQQELYLKTSSPGSTGEKALTLALEPVQMIEGRVLTADSGSPVPNAIVAVNTRQHNQHSNGIIPTRFQADKEGRFKINPRIGESYTLNAFPTGGEPYLIPNHEIVLPKGSINLKHDIKLPRGVLIRGKLTEAKTGRPIAGGSVQYIPSIAIRRREDILSGWQAIVASGDDGMFQIVVSPGKGHLLVFGPTGRFVLEEIGSNRLHYDKPGGIRYKAHKIIPYDAKVGDSTLSINAELEPALTIKGRVEGPDGTVVAKAQMLTTLRIEAFNPYWRGDSQIKVRDGRFQIDGLSPGATTRISIFDLEHDWGATAELSSKAANDEVLIRLEPCGQAKARIVNADRKPLPGYRPPIVEFVAADGPARFSQSADDQSKMLADAASMLTIDRKHYGNFGKTDANGQVTYPALIPGAHYRITDFSTVNDATKGPQGRKDFTVKPGETIDLGDILIEKPAAP